MSISAFWSTHNARIWIRGFRIYFSYRLIILNWNIVVWFGWFFYRSSKERWTTWSSTLCAEVFHRVGFSRWSQTMIIQHLFWEWQSTMEVHHQHRHFEEIFVFFLFRLIEITLSSQMYLLPFHLHIWSNRSCMDELDNSSNRYYYLEEILKDEVDLGKDCELIPVAHYAKVIRHFLFRRNHSSWWFLLIQSMKIISRMNNLAMRNKNYKLNSI